MQLTLTGEIKLKWYCIHCDWTGFDVIVTDYMDSKIEICPVCEWVCYSEKEIDVSLMTCYPQLKKKYKG